MPLISESERVLQAIRATPLFRGLSAEDQKRLAALAALRNYDRGDFLWRAGDPAEQLTIVVKGRVKIVTHGDTGDTILELFEEGEPVGAIAVYNYIPYPASAVCMEPVVLLTLPRRDYFELLDRNPDFARAIIRELTKLVVAMARKLQEMRGQKVDARIAQLFLTLAERLGKEVKGGIEIPIQLTRQEIADLVGTTVESSIRVLSRWGRERIVISGENRFLIPSREKLREIAEGS
ncbi:MAG TPA: Crp/Fnr family transcriptional regulator [Candidatus Omnitrophota bacterium]|jgi:CRP/FNR family cyclic AMP-dependent transcriptional regulator|nr:Crp/Fnr family transcriptional regulator [Candidatus Omnitrophota bacterium]